VSSTSRFTIAVGSHIGAYEVLGPIGAGGIGEVYRARDLRLGREVVLKLLLADEAQDPAAREHIEQIGLVP
jgi:serine/threonine protein kinase